MKTLRAEILTPLLFIPVMGGRSAWGWIPKRGLAFLPVLGILALLGVGGWGLSKMRFFHGESKRADVSTKTTEELLAAQNAQGAAAAAYAQTAGEVVSTLPESREKDYLGRALGISLSYLPKPDPQKIIEAQNLKIAVLSGQLELANKLTGDALTRAEAADRRTAQAISSKRASDLALQESAAEARGAEQQAFWLTILVVAALALWLYTKVTHVSPGALASAVADMRNGTNEPNTAIAALDSITTPLQQQMVRGNAWFKSKLGKLFS